MVVVVLKAEIKPLNRSLLLDLRGASRLGRAEHRAYGALCSCWAIKVSRRSRMFEMAKS
jgi:hypothetical protein